MEALDNRVTFKMLVESLANKFKNIMAKSISSDEKLSAITKEMEADTQSKRETARSIRAKMVALADPETVALEPLERAKVRREKLVEAGKKATTENNQSLINQIAQEIKSLDSSIHSMQATYDTLKESYDIALENYKTSLAAFEHVKNNGQALLFSIKAHQDALSIKDSTRKTTSDTSFLNDLEEELNKASNELRSDTAIDKELNKTSIVLEEDNSLNNIFEEFKK